jgi:hypothetical protein
MALLPIDGFASGRIADDVDCAWRDRRMLDSTRGVVRLIGSLRRCTP